MKISLTRIALTLLPVACSFAAPTLAISANSQHANISLAPLAGVPWGSTFEAVKKVLPHSRGLDTSTLDFCKGNSSDACRTFQVILDEHVVGQMHYKVIFLFNTKARLNGVNFYLIDPEKHSINSLRMRYDQVVNLLSQKYGKPSSQQDFTVEELASGEWNAAGETMWHGPETMIWLDAKVFRAPSPNKPPYDHSGVHFFVSYRAKSDALDAL